MRTSERRADKALGRGYIHAGGSRGGGAEGFLAPSTLRSGGGGLSPTTFSEASGGGVSERQRVREREREREKEKEKPPRGGGTGGGGTGGTCPPPTFLTRV